MSHDEIIREVLRERRECLEQMRAEVAKGPNRLIAIIRDHARAFEKRMENEDLYSSGGFLRTMKREFEREDFGDEMNAAIKYL